MWTRLCHCIASTVKLFAENLRFSGQGREPNREHLRIVPHKGYQIGSCSDSIINIAEDKKNHNAAEMCSDFLLKIPESI